MTSISKNVYIDKLDDRVNKYNNTYQKTIKMKPADVKPSMYIDSSKEFNYRDPKFEIGDIVRISKHKNIFAKNYVSNWFEEVFIIKKIKTLFRGHMLLVILIANKFLERCYKKDCKKPMKKFIELLNGKVVTVFSIIELIRKT